MFKSFKVNTAILICAAFILKLLVVNAVISLNGKTNPLAKTQASFETKTTSVQSSGSCDNAEYSAEICEEDSNEETQLKSNPFLLVNVLYSLIGINVVSELQKILPLQRNFSFTESNRYIALQVFRI
ncbi:hypothetical protein CNR22_08405 [Sphingobacteriaceae bacterium]|nr:hypothetical protein CNR22_08405 [Sphingobacteriaceae bacterium]